MNDGRATVDRLTDQPIRGKSRLCVRSEPEAPAVNPDNDRQLLACTDALGSSDIEVQTVFRYIGDISQRQGRKQLTELLRAGGSRLRRIESSVGRQCIWARGLEPILAAGVLSIRNA